MDVSEGLEGVPEGYVLKLEKALYGLKQAGRQWYQTLRDAMKEFGMKRIESDPHTFIIMKKVKGKNMILIIPVYIDDLFPFGNKELVADFEEWIPKYFETSPPCDAHYFLGIRVTRNRNPPTGRPYIALDQSNFAGNILITVPQLFQNREVTNRKTVLPAKPIVPNPQSKNLADKSYIRKFQSAVGQLMYIMLATRPELSYPVGILARHASNPLSQHEDALFHLLGYLAYTIDDTLIFRKDRENKDNPGIMDCYSDADWAGEEHSGRSTSGMINIKNGAAISWGSKRQGVVSTSTMEAEYIALFSTTQNAVWLSSLENQFHLETIKSPEPYTPNVYCDNEAALTVARGGDMSSFKRSRFMNIKYHYVRHVVETSEIDLHQIESEENVADLFTKRLNKKTLTHLKGFFMEAYSKRELEDESEDKSSSDSE